MGFSTTTPSAVTPSRRSWKAVTSRSTTSPVDGRVSTPARSSSAVGLLPDQLDLELAVGDRPHRLEVEPPLERARHLVHAAVADVGGGDHVEAGRGEDDGVVAVELGDVQHLVGQQADQHVLDLRLDARDLLEAADPARRPCASCIGPRTSARGVGPFGEQQRVVPGVVIWSSVVPAVPWTVQVESPEMAAASSSDSIDLAVPGSPTSSRPRLLIRVTTQRSTRASSP